MGMRLTVRGAMWGGRPRPAPGRRTGASAAVQGDRPTKARAAYQAHPIRCAADRGVLPKLSRCPVETAPQPL